MLLFPVLAFIAAPAISGEEPIDIGQTTYIEDMMVSAAAIGTNGLVGGRGYITRHTERSVYDADYTALCWETSTNGLISSVGYGALYAPGYGNRPQTLLWSSNSYSLTTAGLTCANFADGTWTYEGEVLGFKNPDGTLHVDYLESVWKAFERENGTPANTVLNVNGRRVLWQVSPSTAVTGSGFIISSMSGGFSGQVDLDGVATPSNATMPWLGLQLIPPL